MRWLVVVAEYIATAHDTIDNLRKPVQFGCGAMGINSFTYQHTRELLADGTGSLKVQTLMDGKPPKSR